MSNFTEFDGEHHTPITPVDQRQIPARRATDTNLEIIAHKTTRLAGEFTEFKQEMRDAIREIKSSMTYTHATLHEATERAKAAAETAEHSVKTSVQEAMASAFPSGDPNGHRLHHEMVIKKTEAQAAFWEKMKVELSKAGLIGFCGWVLYSLWQSFLQGPHK